MRFFSGRMVADLLARPKARAMLAGPAVLIHGLCAALLSAASLAQKITIFRGAVKSIDHKKPAPLWKRCLAY